MQAVAQERFEEKKPIMYTRAVRRAVPKAGPTTCSSARSARTENLEEGEKMSIFYVVNLELIDMTTNAKAWIGTKEIKKVVKRDRVSL